MTNLFCLACEHAFQGEKNKIGCPSCGSDAVEEITSEEIEGHFEGGFTHDPVKQYWKDSGIEE